jgi:hypothetical protein
MYCHLITLGLVFAIGGSRFNLVSLMLYGR